MEASALPAPISLARTRISIGASLLRLRSDEQLVSLFRAGSEDAFRVIHDRYRQRLFVYSRQMLGGSPQDAEDAVQEIFVRAYASLRCSERELTLRAWLYRVAHNRCIDQLRRPLLPSADTLEHLPGLAQDPVAKAEQREVLRRLIADVQRLPEQQRSALLMRELGGMAYSDLGEALGVSVPAVKSLLVRARVSLAQASVARETACSQIREELILAHDRGVRASGLARRHLRDCPSCSEFRFEVRGVSRQLAAFAPALGPFGVIANLLGIGGGAGAGGSAAASGGAAASSGALAAGGVAAGGVVSTGGALASAGILATGAGHVATLLVAAVVTAGGAAEIQHTIAAPTIRHTHHHRVVSQSYRSAPAATYVAPQVPPAPGYQTTPAPQPLPAAPAPPRHVVERAQLNATGQPASSTTKSSTASLTSATGDPSGTLTSTGSGGTSTSGASASATVAPQGAASTTSGTATVPSSTASTSGGSTATPTTTANSGAGTGVFPATAASGTAVPPTPSSATTTSAPTGTGSGATSSSITTGTSGTPSGTASGNTSGNNTSGNTSGAASGVTSGTGS